jgi:hypothetical protein
MNGHSINSQFQRYKQMKKLIYILSVFTSALLAATQVKAQNTPPSPPPPPPLFNGKEITDYQIAAGLKFGGYENGISGKFFVAKDIAIEGVIGFRRNGLVLTGLYEIHQTAFNVPALKFYYGGGGHVGSIGAGTYQSINGDRHVYTSTQLLLGLDGVIGLEYIIPKSPIAVSLDLNPRIELAKGPFFDIAPGLGIKYTFQ